MVFLGRCRVLGTNLALGVRERVNHFLQLLNNKPCSDFHDYSLEYQPKSYSDVIRIVGVWKPEFVELWIERRDFHFVNGLTLECAGRESYFEIIYDLEAILQNLPYVWPTRQRLLTITEKYIAAKS